MCRSRNSEQACLPTDANFGIEPESQWGSFTDGATGVREVVPSERGRWTDFYSQVRACIETGAPPPVAATEAREVIRMIEAALESSAKGRESEWVDAPHWSRQVTAPDCRSVLDSRGRRFCWPWLRSGRTLVPIRLHFLAERIDVGVEHRHDEQRQ